MGGTLTTRPDSRVGGCKYCSSERGKHDLRTETGRARCWVSEGTDLIPTSMPTPVQHCDCAVCDGWLVVV
jgi:hypothetical protein